MVTEGDIVKLLASIPPSIYVPVKDVMIRTLITINSSDLVKDALVLMFLKNAKTLIFLEVSKRKVLLKNSFIIIYWAFNILVSIGFQTQ